MSYQTNLNWLENLSIFSMEQKKVLLALSDDRYKWRAIDRLQDVTALEKDVLEKTLAQLMKRELVLPNISKKRNLIFGLRERVDAK